MTSIDKKDSLKVKKTWQKFQGNLDIFYSVYMRFKIQINLFEVIFSFHKTVL